jgi:hypothetical protein
MADSRYGKYIITELKAASPLTTGRPPAPPDDIAATRSHTKLLYLDDAIIKGAFYTECVWIWPGDFYPTRAEPRAHAHDYDEIITFFGSNFADPYDLCGEIELWLEDEPHLLTRSCIVFVPKGMKHCPLVIRRVDRPIFHVSAGTGGVYLHREG